MTNLISFSRRRFLRFPTVVGLLVILVISSTLLRAQAARTSRTQEAAAPAANRWEPAIHKFEEQDKVSPPPQHAILFVGASSIVRWNLPQYFPELGPKVINRGFGGSVMADSVRYADRIVIPYKPRLVVLYAGDNDVEAGIPPRQIAGGFAEFDRKVHAALPETRIIFISIKPSLRRWKWIDQIRESNALVREYCTKHPNLAYVDIERQMLGADGKPNPELLVEDGLHMTPKAYSIWTAALKPLLN